MQRRSGYLLCVVLPALLFAVFFSGCGGTRPQEQLPVEPMELYPVDADGRTGVTIFYATDRALSDTSEAPALFSGDRGEMYYGQCRVTIPPEHQIGVLETPSGIKFWQKMNPDDHVYLQETMILDRDSAFTNIRRRVNSHPQRKLFLLIHGYNVSFADAARRTAQLANDMRFTGAAVLYSWPSKGSMSAYTVDEATVQWAQPHFQDFLLALLEDIPAESVYLMAHSMGNRLLARVLTTLAVSRNPTVLSAVKEIVFIAPDIDAQDFRQNLGPQIARFGIPVTLYVSSEDKALKASKKVHGYERAGESVIILRGIETIDATMASDDFLGHSYFASSRDIIGDLYYLLRDRFRAGERFGLKEVSTPQGVYWKMKK
jgi:esterase/lipase superfamily enzyme